jgi:hypothetical protein
VGKGAEDERRFAERGTLGVYELDGVTADAHARAPLIISGREGEFKLGVAENERAQLAASIATCPEHSDRCSIHSECIIMRQATVNGTGLGWLSSR